MQASRWALTLGIPTAAWGAALFAAGAVLAALAGRPGSPRWWLGAFILAVAGVAFIAYLTAIALFAIGAACFWCLAAGALALAFLGALLAARPAASRRSWARWPRVGVLGAATAISTVVLGLGLHAGPGSGATDFQVALARHLADSGAIMYGAFW